MSLGQVHEPHRRPRRPPAEVEAPGPGWRRSPSGVWLPPWQGVEVVQAGAGAAALGGRRPAAASFSPADLGPYVWLSSDPAYAYQDSTGSPPGSTLVSATAQDVGAVRDRGSLGAHASQASAGLRPNVAQLSPLHLSHATGDYLSFSGAVSNGTARTFAFRFRLPTVPVGTYNCLFSLRGTSHMGVLYIGPGGSSYPRVFFLFGQSYGGSPAVRGEDRTLDTSWHTLLVEYDGAGGYLAWWDGSAMTLITGAAFPRSAGDLSAIGTELVDGSPSSSTAVDWAELLVLPTLTSGQRTDLLTYLAAT